MAIPFSERNGGTGHTQRLSSPFPSVIRAALRLLGSVALLSILTGTNLLAAPASSTARKEQAHEQFDKAEQMREALNGRPADQRTRKDYQRVADAYRKVYYVAPASSKADTSVVAVAEILADMGRQFQPDDKDLRAAISQYEFLRREYPGSKYRFQALFTIGQIYKEDLDDDDAARQTFQEFLKHYPRNSLAADAKQALAELNHPQPSKKPIEEAHTNKDETPAAEPASLSAAKKKSALSMVTGIRHWSTPDYTRVAIDVDSEVKYEAGRVPNPDRIFFDLPDTKLASVLVGKSFDVQDGFLKKIRVAQYQPGSTRVVLEVADVSDYSAFLLPNPYRLIIDIHGRQPQSPTQVARANAAAPPGSDDQSVTAVESEKPYRSVEKANEAAKSNAASNSTGVPRKTASSLNMTTGSLAATTTQSARPIPSASSASSKAAPRKIVVNDDDDDDSSEAAATPPPKTLSSKSSKPAENSSSTSAAPAAGSTTAQKASTKPKQTTTAATAKVPDPLFSGPGDASGPELKATTQPTTAPTAVAVAPRSNKKTTKTAAANVPPTHEAEPTSSGDRSLTRALGLKIGRIVVDAGHGGHDTGTIGPNGLLEKDLVLDVALRLGRLLETQLGADVIYTRDDDTFIPLETRTAIANEHQADLFISVHANSSSDPSARGVETYYLNFTSNPDALEVAARENAVSEKSIFELQDLVKKITLKDKIDESRELATDVQQCLFSGLAGHHSTLRDRGVKKAPFVVLIGANMPSILAEISFVSNPTDEAKLETPEYREKIAESLYKGIAKYADGLSGVKVAAKFNKQDGQ
jgi:N-acetylmuramoyl-L-alanine amidase